MAKPKLTPGEVDRTRLDEMVLTRVGDEAVIRPLDGVSLDEVKRMVAAERSRNRRSVVWTSTLLLGIFLFFLVIFLSVGVYVMHLRNETGAALAGLRGQAGQQANALSGVSDRVAALETTQVDVDGLLQRIESAEVERGRERDTLLADFDQFRRSQDAQNARREESLATLERRLEAMEAAAQGALAELRTDLDQRMGAAPAPVHTGMPVFGNWVETPQAPGAPADAAPDLTALELTDAALEAAGVFTLPDPEDFAPGSERREIEVVAFPNGDRYEGELVSGIMHGWGIYTSANGDRYEGTFLEGFREGRGTLLYASGGRYTGEFRMDVREGRGSTVYANGDRHSGQYRQDRPDGHGSMLYANGNKYAGNFRAGLRHGIGVFRFANGDLYRGAFSEDQRTGPGLYVFADGSRYQGAFVNGRRHGQGQYIYATGEAYLGAFQDGQRHGIGLSTFPNGRQVKGLWEQDRMVRVLPMD